jgi:DNA invertase Pin-like site-specific DNA recombinase
MTRGVRLADEKRQYIKEAIETKFPVQIARELGCSVQTVKNILRENPD